MQRTVLFTQDVNEIAEQLLLHSERVGLILVAESLENLHTPENL